jgi:hypothetical protein
LVGEGNTKLTIAEVLVHSSVRGNLLTLHTLSNQCLLQSLAGNPLDFDVHGRLLSLELVSWFAQGKRTHGHDDEDHLRILLGLQKGLFGRILESSVDTLKIKSGISLEINGSLVGNWTSALDENVDELSDKALCVRQH